MKKILLTFVIFFSSQAAFANCDLQNIGLGEKFHVLKDKYKFRDATSGGKKFYKNIRGKEICDELGKSEVSMLFVKKQLAKVHIYKVSDSNIIFSLASQNFGEPLRKPNLDDPKLHTYSTFWAEGKDVIVYSFTLSPDKTKFTEKLVLQNKELSHDIASVTNMDEDKQSKKDDKEEDDDDTE